MSEQNMNVKVQIVGKNTLVAYLLWWFSGWAGAHRLYLGHTKTALTQLALVIVGWVTMLFFVGWIFLGVWFIWWMLDVYFTFKMVEEANAKLGVENSSIALSKSGNANDSDNLEQLEKLHSLFEKGVLTKEQYEEKKAGLI